MSTKQDLVSIIVPVYNIENYLPRCLETIAAQTYGELEIILVDDGSTDSSGTICDEFAKTDRRAKVIHQQNKGLSGARNTGKECANGEYIMFVDGDDYLHVDAVNVLWTAINSDSKYDIAIGGYVKTYSLDEDWHLDTNVSYTAITQKELIKSMLTDKNEEKKLQNNVVWNKLYRKEDINSIAFENCMPSEDFDFNFKTYLIIDKAIEVNRTLYYYVQRPGSILRSKGSLIKHYSTRSTLFYTHFMALTDSNKKYYGYQLLRVLYRKMTLWKGRTFQTDAEKDTFQKCRQYERDTRRAYWLSGRINPIEKIGVAILLHNPRLTRWLMKATKNW